MEETRNILQLVNNATFDLSMELYSSESDATSRPATQYSCR
jgi:hypothetical protein